MTTDGFLYPTQILEARGLMRRKGFPESYDLRRMISFLGALKAGTAEVLAPVYSHLEYDIMPGEWQSVRQPDIVIDPAWVVLGWRLLESPYFLAMVHRGHAELDACGAGGTAAAGDRAARKRPDYEAIARQVGLSHNGVFDICKRFAAKGAGGTAKRPAGPAPGTGSLPDRGAGGGDARADPPRTRRMSWPALCAVEPGGGAGADRAALRRAPGGAHDGHVPGTLGFYGAKAAAAGL